MKNMNCEINKMNIQNNTYLYNNPFSLIFQK